MKLVDVMGKLAGIWAAISNTNVVQPSLEAEQTPTPSPDRKQPPDGEVQRAPQKGDEATAGH